MRKSDRRKKRISIRKSLTSYAVITSNIRRSLRSCFLRSPDLYRAAVSIKTTNLINHITRLH